MRSFDEGARELERQVGHGTLTALAHFPGPSSAALERSYWVSGPNAGVHIEHYHGGGPHFLARALDRDDLRPIAKACLDGRGVDECFERARATAERASAAAPVRTGLLRLSVGHAALDDGVVARERPALPASVVPRALTGRQPRQLGAGRQHRHVHPTP